MSNTWTVALTFEDEEEKELVQQIVKEMAKRQYRSPSSLIRIIILNYAKQQAENL